MSGRLFCNFWKLQRNNQLVQRIHFQAARTSYAMTALTTAGIPLETLHEQNKQLLNIAITANTASKHAKRSYAVAKTAPHAYKPLNVEMLLERLQSHSFVNYELFVKLLELLEAQPNSYNQLLNSEQTLFLLGACGELMPAQKSAERLQLFERLWLYMKQNEQLTSAHYHVKLQVLKYNRAALENVQEFLQEMPKETQQSAEVLKDLYAELLEVACHSGNMRQATAILAEMRELNLALTKRNFNALIVGHGRSCNLSSCQTVLESLIAANLLPDNSTHIALIRAHLECGEEAKALDIFKKYQQDFKPAHIMEILHATLLAELSSEFIIQLINELPAEFRCGSEVHVALRSLCIELLHNNKLDAVKTIINALPKPTLSEHESSDRYGVFLLQEVLRARLSHEQIIEIVDMLVSSQKNLRALHIVIEIVMRRNPVLALPLMEALAKVESLRPHYFWPLMMYNLRKHGERGIMQTLKLMTQYVPCDQQTITQYVIPNLSVSLENPIQTVKQLDEAGVRATSTLSHIIAHSLLQQQLEEAQKLIELYPTKLDLSELLIPLRNQAVTVRATKRYQSFAKLLQALYKKSDNSKFDFIGQLLIDMLSQQSRLGTDFYAVRRFIQEMHKYELRLSNAAADIIRSTLQQQTMPTESEMLALSNTLKQMSSQSLNLATHEGAAGTPLHVIKHPRDMTLDELECHLIELEAKSLNTRGLLRRLLQLCVRDGRLERALEVKKKCDVLKVQVSAGMLASIFDLYIKLNDLPNADKSLKLLQSSFPGFQIDEHKILDFAALLVREQQLDTAKQLLAERAATHKIIGGDYVLKNVWNFLTNVAQLAATTASLTAEHNLTRDCFVFLQQHGYCYSQNAILGPIIREWLNRGNIHEAIAEFRKLADQYKHTPLQFELLSLLVRLCNAQSPDIERFPISNELAQQLLNETTQIIAKIHGVINMNSALLLAFAESGTDAQLRRLLINPEYRINQELLLKNCEHLGQEGSIQTLLRLGRCARGLSHVIDEQGIYTMLLNNFVKLSDCDAALKLFERLEADDELKISQQFLRDLVQLLKVNNREIPSNIALRAQII